MEPTIHNKLGPISGYFLEYILLIRVSRVALLLIIFEINHMDTQEFD